MTRLLPLAALLLIAMTTVNPEPAFAKGGSTGSSINANVGGGGVDIRGRDLKAGQEGSAAIPTFIRAVTPACPGNDANAGGPYDISCSYMTTFCQLRGEGDGPMTWVWRRPLDAEGRPAGRWRRVGYSCNEPLPDHDLSLAEVRTAFRRVDFARPRLLSQPGGGWALVNFDTYYQVGWPEQGVRPQQVATVHLLGHEVAIRPKIVTYEYDYGDGEKKRTNDPGGSYPEGAVRHVYQRVGEVTIRVTARYSADFSVDGGAFRGLDDTVDIAGPVRTLRVYQARAQLIPNPGEE